MQRRGYLRITGPDQDVEQDIIVCGHCQFTRDPKTGDFSYCSQCDSLICPRCTKERNAGGCKSFKQRIDEQVAASARVERMLRR